MFSKQSLDLIISQGLLSKYSKPNSFTVAVGIATATLGYVGLVVIRWF